MLDAKTWIDIDLLGVGTYLNNDFIYLRNSSVTSILKSRKTNGGTPLVSEDDIIYNQTRNRYHAYSRTFANALIGVWSQGDHAIGIHFGGRAYVDARRLDGTFAQFIENGVTLYTPQHLTDYASKKLRVNVLTYGQAQISYAYTFSKKQRVMMMGGISLKKIFPIVGAAVAINEFTYNVRDAVQWSIFSLKADMMGALQPSFSMRGGWGIDLGFTYQKMYKDCSNYYPNSKKGGCGRVPYKWKLGLSIIDIGYAKFDPDNVNYVGYDFSSYEFFNYANVSIDQNTFQNILIDAEPDPANGLIRKPFKMSLPCAFSLQYDYNVKKNFFYLNLSWMHGIPRSRGAFGPRRAHWICFTPRIETKFFDIALPISLYEYRYPQIGLSARLYFLTIGTDKLGSWIFKGDLYGTDIYAQIKLPLFRNPKCKRRGKGKKGRSYRGSKEWPHCDAYN